MSLFFLGDISLNDNYRSKEVLDSLPFNEFRNIINDNDFVIGNLESIAKGDKGENSLKKPRLTTDVESLKLLKDLKLNLACLAQNHIFDHLDDGFLKTANFLEKEKISYIGASINHENNNEFIISQNNTKIGILNYVTLDTNPGIPENSKINLSIFELNKVIKDVENLKDKVDQIVLFLHWGGIVEGGKFPDLNQPKIARKLIDNGVDLIIGHHPHVIQPLEIYKGKSIYYSLGNFCFDNVLFEGKFFPLSKERKRGLVIQVYFEKKSYQIKHHFIKNDNLQIRIDEKGERRFTLLNLIFKLFLKNKLIWKIYFINLKKIKPFRLFLFRKDITSGDKLNRIIKSFLKKIN